MSAPDVVMEQPFNFFPAFARHLGFTPHISESLSSKFAPVTFPTRLHLGHELSESRISSDRIEK